MKSYNRVKELLLEYGRSTDMADAADVELLKWSQMHVFWGVGQYIKGRNRGRLPYLEISIGPSLLAATDRDGGGTHTATASVRIHVASKCHSSVEQGDTQPLAYGLAGTFLRLIRKEFVLSNGDSQIGQLQVSPIGSYVDLEFSVELTYTNTYGT